MAPAFIHVARVSPTLAAGIRAITVAPWRRRETGNIAFNLDAAESDPHSEAMAVLADGRIIGFYRIDLQPALPFASGRADALVLRDVAIDAAHGGPMIELRAMTTIAADIRRRHPDRRLLFATAPCALPDLLAMYRRTGFVDTGVFIASRAGTRHLLHRYLPRPSERLLHERRP